MKLMQDDLDTSNYSSDHFLCSTKNKKVIGKFKDELEDGLSELVFLRSKAYAYLVENKDVKRF